MYKEMTVLGLVPARGGSKGLPGKNIMPLAGKPLIAWTIEAALASTYMDKVIVSTDNEEIAATAQRYGAQVPFLRPAALATDKAKMVDVILHALHHFEKSGERFDLFVLLQPTSPLRLTEDIDRALEFMFSKKADVVVSVSKAGHHPLWANTLPESLSMKDFLRTEVINKNRQELPVYYRANGALYLCFWEYLKRTGSFFGKNTYAYKMPEERSVDVDRHLDLKLCELLLTERKSREEKGNP